MAMDSSVSERTQKANGEAKVLLSVILGFSAVVVLFMVFMMANAPREGVIYCDEPAQIPPQLDSQSKSQSNSDTRLIKLTLPLHPSFPGSSDSDCIQPRYFQNT